MRWVAKLVARLLPPAALLHLSLSFPSLCEASCACLSKLTGKEGGGGTKTEKAWNSSNILPLQLDEIVFDTGQCHFNFLYIHTIALID